MFGLQILVSDGHMIRVLKDSRTMPLIDSEWVGFPTAMVGPVGLYLTRREYRSRLRDWYANAWSWACGRQDYIGEILDDCRDRVESFGFDSRIDRAAVRAERERYES